MVFSNWQVSRQDSTLFSVQEDDRNLTHRLTGVKPTSIWTSWQLRRRFYAPANLPRWAATRSVQDDTPGNRRSTRLHWEFIRLLNYSAKTNWMKFKIPHFVLVYIHSALNATHNLFASLLNSVTLWQHHNKQLCVSPVYSFPYFFHTKN